jgi:hypothetical protein
LKKRDCSGANVLDFTGETITGERYALSVQRNDYENIGTFYKNISFLNLERAKFQYDDQKIRSGSSTFVGAATDQEEKFTFKTLTKISLKFANFATSSREEAGLLSIGNRTFAYAKFPKLKSIDMSNSI